jgi:hypothetical protein
MFPRRLGGPFGVLLELSIILSRSYVELKLFLRSFGAVRSYGGGPTGVGMSTLCADLDR